MQTSLELKQCCKSVTNKPRNFSSRRSRAFQQLRHFVKALRRESVNTPSLKEQIGDNSPSPGNISIENPGRDNLFNILKIVLWRRKSRMSLQHKGAFKILIVKDLVIALLQALFLRNTLAARLAPIFSAYWGALFSLGCKTTILETAKACSLLEWRRMSCSGIESWVHNRPKPTGVLYEAVKHIAKFCENNPGLMGKRVQDLRVKSVLLNAIQKSRAEVALECSFMQ